MRPHVRPTQSLVLPSEQDCLFMTSIPWYKEGLRFQCTECGKCCTGKPGYIWITEEEIKAMADQLQITEQAFKIKYTRTRDNRYALVELKDDKGNNRCIFLKGKRCEVYQARPGQCRTFPWWKENLHNEESWKLAAEDCEGINEEAPLVPYAEIERSLSE